MIVLPVLLAASGESVEALLVKGGEELSFGGGVLTKFLMQRLLMEIIVP